MELQKHSYRYQRQVARQKGYREELTELMVPEGAPDLGRIVDTSGVIYIRDWDVGEDELLLRCAARVTVLYQTEEDSHLYHLEAPISFTHRMELRGAAPGCEILCGATLTSADARMLGPRRAAIRIQAVLSPRVYTETEEICAVGVTEPGGVCMKYQTLSHQAITSAAYKNFTLVEDIDVPAEFGALRSVLRSELQLRTTDIKLLPGRVMVKADAEIRALCETAEGEYRSLQHRFSFTQMADVPGAEEGQAVDCCFTLRSMELDPALDLSGDSRYLSLSAGIMMNLELSQMTELRILSDLYGTRQRCTPSYKELRLSDCGTVYRVRTSAEAQAETASPIKSVLDYRVQMEDSADCLSDEQQAQLGTLVTILCEGEDGACFTIQRRLPLRFGVPDEMDSAMVRTDAWELTAEPKTGGLSLRLQADLLLRAGMDISAGIVDQLEWGEAYAAEEDGGFSVLLRRAAGEESLWQIAKEYHIHADAIAQANRMAADAVPADGTLLLIPMRK